MSILYTHGSRPSVGFGLFDRGRISDGPFLPGVREDWANRYDRGRISDGPFLPGVREDWANRYDRYNDLLQNIISKNLLF